MTIPPSVLRVSRYLAIGVATFLLDLNILYALVDIVHVPYYVATFFSFLFAVSCNYALSRKYVFHGTKRRWFHGYGYFMLFALGGAALTTLLVTVAVSWLGIYYLVARITVAGVIGTGNYLLNLYLNFKVVGKHHSHQDEVK